MFFNFYLTCQTNSKMVFTKFKLIQNKFTLIFTSSLSLEEDKILKFSWELSELLPEYEFSVESGSEPPKTSHSKLPGFFFIEYLLVYSVRFCWGTAMLFKKFQVTKWFKKMQNFCSMRTGNIFITPLMTYSTLNTVGIKYKLFKHVQ